MIKLFTGPRPDKVVLTTFDPLATPMQILERIFEKADFWEIEFKDPDEDEEFMWKSADIRMRIRRARDLDKPIYVDDHEFRGNESEETIGRFLEEFGALPVVGADDSEALELVQPGEVESPSFYRIGVDDENAHKFIKRKKKKMTV